MKFRYNLKFWCPQDLEFVDGDMKISDSGNYYAIKCKICSMNLAIIDLESD